jgi:hypothetical protein
MREYIVRPLHVKEWSSVTVTPSAALVVTTNVVTGHQTISDLSLDSAFSVLEYARTNPEAYITYDQE